MDESLEGGAGVKALTQQLQRLDAVVAERVDAVLAARGRCVQKWVEREVVLDWGVHGVGAA